MSETHSPVKAVKTDYICDRCSEGCMVGTNVGNLTTLFSTSTDVMCVDGPLHSPKFILTSNTFRRRTNEHNP